MNTLDRGFEAGIADLTPGRCAVDMLVVRRRGNLNAELDEPGANRLDTPSQTASAAAALMLTDEANDQCCGRSSSAAKKADAVFRIALARLSSAFSRLSLLSSADSSVDTPGREPPSISAWRTHLRTVSAVPTPSSRATSLIAAHSESC